MGFLGGFEWVIIIVVILLLFGGKKIPQLMRGLGQGWVEFRKAKDWEKDDDDDDRLSDS